LSPAYKVTSIDKQGRFEIEKRIFTDPDRNALFVRVTVRALKGPVTPFLVLEPHMANTGGGDAGAASASALTAYEGKAFLSLKGGKPFVKAVAAPLGADALSAVKGRDPDRRRLGQGRHRPDRSAAAAGLGLRRPTTSPSASAATRRPPTKPLRPR
jgi:glucoamylase